MNKEFDVAIIGGGTVGTMIFLDAVSRGLKTILLEKNTIGTATNRASLGLFQAGANYLTKDIDLIRMNALDCILMKKLAGNLLKEQKILIPLFSDSRHPLWLFDSVFSAYDSLRGQSKAGLHKKLSKTEVLNEETFLRNDITGGILFSELIAEPVSLTKMLAEYGKSFGGIIMENTAVIFASFEELGDVKNVKSILVKKVENKEKITASCFINAAGPWSPVVLEKVFGLPAFKTRMTRGTSIIIDKKITKNAVILFEENGKYITILPQENDKTLIGPTNHDINALIAANPDNLQHEESEIKELLTAVSKYLKCEITEKDISEIKCGLRPQLNHRRVKPNDITHEFMIIKHNDRDGVKNLLTVFGGKLSNQIRMAKETVDSACLILGERKSRKVPFTAAIDGKISISDTNDSQTANLVSLYKKRAALSYNSRINKVTLRKRAKSLGYLAKFVVAGLIKELLGLGRKNK